MGKARVGLMGKRVVDLTGREFVFCFHPTGIVLIEVSLSCS